MAWTWDNKGTTATYEEESTNTKIVVKGAKASATLPEPDSTNGTITLTSNMLDGKAVSITTSKLDRTGDDDAIAYRLVLDSSVIGTPTYFWSAPAVKEGAKEAAVTVTYACEYTSNYKINGRNIAYMKNSTKTTQNIFTISGVNNQSLAGLPKATKSDDAQSEKIAALFTTFADSMSSAIEVIPTAAAFTKANMVINTSNKAMLPADDNAHTISLQGSGGPADEATYSYQWSFNSATAAVYKETQNIYYQDSSDTEANVKPNTIKYNAAKTATLATVNGLNANYKTSVEDAHLNTEFSEQTATTADAKLIAAIQATATQTDSAALVAARAAYTKSLGTKTYADLTTAQQATIIKAARTAYFKDETVIKAVSELITATNGGALTGLDTGNTAPYEDATITVGAAALGTANLTLNRGKNLDKDSTEYKLALGSDVMDGTTNETPTITVGNDKYAWVIAGTTAKLQKMTTSAGYTPDNDARNPVIKYTKLVTSTKADDTLVSISGLKSGIVADGAGSLDDFFTVNASTGVITLKQAALGTADIKITDNDSSKYWTFAFANGIATAANKIYSPTYTADNSATKTSGDTTKTDGLSWDYKNGTAKLVQTLQPGHTMSHDSKTVYYNVGNKTKTNTAGTKDITIAQLTGLATGISNIDNVLDYSFTETTGTGQDAVTTNKPVITVGATALNKKPVTTTGTGNFTLKLNDVAGSAGGQVTEKASTDSAKLSLPSANAKYFQTIGIGYAVDTTGKKITYNAKATESVLATISGFATLYKDLSAEAKTAVTLDTASKASAEGDSAALTAAKTAYSNALTGIANPTAAQKNTALKAANQAYIDTRAGESISVSGKVFTLKNTALTSKTNIVLTTKGDYTVALDSSDTTIPTEDTDDGASKWNVSGTTATYQGHHNAFYKEETEGAKAGKQITYTRESWNTKDPNTIKITGLNKNVSLNNDTASDDDITVTEGAITLNYNALSTTPIVVTAKGTYANADLKLGDDVTYQTEAKAKEAKKAGWIINGTNATYQTFTPAYYTIDNSNNKIAYHAMAKEGNALITLTGVKSGLTTDANGVVDNRNIDVVMTNANGAAVTDAAEATSINVVMKAGALDTKNGGKVTIKGTGYYADAELKLFTSDTTGDEDVPAVSSGDTFAYSGTGTNASVVLKAGTEGYICDGKTITYSDGSASAPTLATITGLKTGLTDTELANAVKLVSEVVPPTTTTTTDPTNSGATTDPDETESTGSTTAAKTIIQISKAALNDKAVSLNTTGGYTLALAKDTATTDVTVSNTPSLAYKNATAMTGDVQVTQRITEKTYENDSSGKKINYYPSEKTNTVATISGVATGKDATALAAAVSVDVDDKIITINEAAFDTKHSTIKTTSKDYNLALGKDSAATPADLKDVLNDQEATFKYNSTGKKVELAQAASEDGYALALDSKSISYYEKDARGPVLATITGLNSEAVSDATKLASGVTLAGKKITLKGSVLGTAAVSITDPYSQNYEFVLDEIQYKEDGQTVKDGDTGTVNTNDSVKFDGWIVSGTTATLNDDATKAYYTLANNKVTYTAAKKGTELVKVSGLKSGLLPDTDGNIWTDKENSLKTIDLNTTTNKITLDKNALGTSNITVSDSNYSLVLLDKTNYPTRGVDTSTTSYEWSATPAGAVTLNQVITEGYEVVSNVVQRTAAKTTTVGTLTGYNPDIKTDAEFNAAALETANFTTEQTEPAASATIEAKAQYAAYKAYKDSLGDKTSDTAKATALTAAKNAYISSAIANTISSYLDLGTVNDQSVFSKATASTDISTVNAYQIKNEAIFGTTDLKLTGSGGFTFALGDSITKSAATGADAWIISGTKATLNTNCKSEYYSLANDNKTVTYNPAETTNDSKATAVLTGIKSGLKNGRLSNFITSATANSITTYTLTQAVLGTSKLTVSNGSETAETSPKNYKLAIDSEVTVATLNGTAANRTQGADVLTFGADVSLSGTTATLKQDQTKGYMLNTANNEISYISADKTATLATISNLNSGLKTTLDTAADALTASDFASEPTAVTKPTDTSAANYATQLADYKAYVINKAAYDAYKAVITADSTATEAALAAAKDAYYNTALAAAIEVDKDTGVIVLSDDAIGTSTTTKKVTLSTTEGYKLAAANEAADATTAYEWTVTGNNATYNHKQVAGNVTALDGKSITYSATGTTTPLAVVTGFNKALNGDATEFVKHVAVKQTAGSNSTNVTKPDAKGHVIEVDATALKDTTAVKISTNNNSYQLGVEDKTATPIEASTGKAGWVIDTKTGTAEYMTAITSAYYKMDDTTAPQSLTYTAAVKDDGATTTYTVTGLKKNTRFESSDIVYDSSAKTITLSENTLGSTVTKVELEKAEGATEARLALGKATDGTQMTATKTGSPTWSFSGTTATLKETRPAGYEISSDGTTITNIKTAQTATRATVSGIAKLDTIDASTINETSMTTGYKENSADGYTKKAYAAYNKSLYGYEDPTDEQKRAVTVTDAMKATALTAAQTAYREAKMSDSLTVGTTTVGTEEVPAITVGKTALGTTAVSVTAGKDVNGTATSYTFVLDNSNTDDKVPVDSTPSNAWYISGTKAEYVSCVPAHYTLAENKITYTAQAKADSTATSAIVIDGLKSGATASGITLGDGTTAAKKTITLSKDVLGTGTTKISSTNSTYADYKLDFATSEDALVYATSITPTWDQGTTTKLNISQKAQTYMLALDGKSITYSATAKDNTVATIGGLVAKPKFGDMKKYSEDGGKTITITGTQVAEAKAATVDGKDYTFTFNNTYNGTVDSTTGDVTSYAKITGGTNADKIVAEGYGLEIAGGKGDDTITLASSRTTGDRITFATGDGDDVVANFTTADYIKTAVAASGITVNRGETPTTTSDVVIDFNGGGTITLKGYGKNAINFVNNNGTAIEVTGAEYTSSATGNNRSLLYDDNYMETTPVLSSITDITADDYSVGNIEGAADLTKLTKEETPIIASSK